MQFEWDEQKDRINRQKHGITFKEASQVFFDELSATGDDTEHSEDEKRLITFGLSLRRELLVVCHVDRGNAVRIVSARRATRAERRIYEQA